ncbi:MAG: NAD(P)H-hydrate dehydratase [Ilumatobacteraceae bacterium]
MIPVLTPVEMGAVDRAAEVPVDVLVGRAGAAVERAAVRLLGGSYGRTVNVIAGPGNNGADGRVAAERLRARGVRVRVFPADGFPARLPPSDLVIDAAFGTGFRGTWRPPDVGGAKVLAVDVPTGVDGLTGVAAGPVLRADTTVTFGAAKPGLHLGAGRELSGEVVVADIGLDVSRASIGRVEAADVAGWLEPRARTAHKWTNAVRVVAGSPGMTGAAHLAADAAQRSGAGIVHLSSPGIEPDAPVEVVVRRAPGFDWHEPVLADLHRFGSLVLGPGLGREDYTVASVTEVIRDAVVPVVVDGDGLFALSWNEAGAPVMLREREVPTLLTPHDGEFALLTGSSPGADRILSTRRLAADTGAVVLLKGPTTIVAEPDGRVRLVTDGDERLATAGSGDVLAGIIGALVGTGLDVAAAAAAGAWIHAAAGRACPRRGTVASDLVAALPEVFASIPVPT